METNVQTLGNSQNLMKNVLLRAPILTASGYGVHSRQIARWLLELENQGKIRLTIQALAWGDTPWLIDQNRNDGFIGKLMQHTSQPTEKFDVSFQLQLPNEWDNSLANKNIGITAAVETDKCNPEWAMSCNKMQKIVVPSEHTKKTLVSSGPVSTPIIVIPESYPDCFRDTPVQTDFQFETSNNYLVFGQLTGNNPMTDRKNLFFTIKWIYEALKDKKNVGIVVKTNAGRNTKIDRHVVRNTLAQLRKEIMKNDEIKLYLVHGDMSDNDVFSLVSNPTIKAMVSLTRGEGFGLPILEAASAGLPVIATNWSAHTEFLNHGRWIGVDYRLSEIPNDRIDNRIFIKGTKWAEPLEDDFKRKIRKFHDSNSIPREWARDLKTKILEKYSHEYISSLYSKEFQDIL